MVVVCFAQESSINIFGTIRKYLDDQAIRNIVLPNAKSLFYKSSSVRVSSLFSLNTLQLHAILLLDWRL